MLNTIPMVMRTEWRLLAADKTPRVALLLLISAVGYAAYTGREWRRFESRAVAAASAADVSDRRQLRSALDSFSRLPTPPAAFGDPRNANTAGTRSARPYAILQPTGLVAAAIGQSDLLPSYYRVSMTSRETFFVNDEIENPVNLVAGRFDLAFVATVLIPLLVIALSYNILSEDRESGALAMLLAQPVSPRSVIAGKLLARGVAMVALVAVVTLGGLLAAGATVIGPEWPRAALFVLVVVAYTLFWLALAVGVAVFNWTSATNALALLAAWLVLVVLVPSLANFAVTTAYPMPSRIALIQATRDASNSASAHGSQLLSMYYQDHPELMSARLPGMDFGARTIAVQEEVDRAVTPLMRAFDRQLALQQDAVDRWRYASPALAVHEAFSDIAGTNVRRYRRFGQQVDAFVEQLRAFFSPLVVHGVTFATAHLDAVPTFRFEDERIEAVSRRGVATLAYLVAVAMAIIAIAIIPLRRPAALVAR